MRDIYLNYSNLVSGFNATAAKVGLTNPQLVQRAATFADDFVPFTKNAGVTGTLKHEAATTLLKRYQNIYGYRGLDFKEEMKKLGTTNPDFSWDNLIIINPNNKKFINTGFSINKY